MLEILKKTDLFTNLSEEQIEHLLSFITYKIKTYQKGEVLFHEGDQCKALGIVLEGKIELQNIFPSGKAVRYLEMGPGGIFGEALLYGEKRLYPVTVGAFTPVKVLLLDEERLTVGLMNHPILLRNYLKLISDKLFFLNHKIKLLSMDTIRKKIVSFLLQQVQQQKSEKIICKMTREQLAEHLAIPRPSLSRELIKMQDEGLLTFEKSIFEINDVEELEFELF